MRPTWMVAGLLLVALPSPAEADDEDASAPVAIPGALVRHITPVAGGACGEDHLVAVRLLEPRRIAGRELLVWEEDRQERSGAGACDAGAGAQVTRVERYTTLGVADPGGEKLLGERLASRVEVRAAGARRPAVVETRVAASWDDVDGDGEPELALQPISPPGPERLMHFHEARVLEGPREAWSCGAAASARAGAARRAAERFAAATPASDREARCLVWGVLAAGAAAHRTKLPDGPDGASRVLLLPGLTPGARVAVYTSAGRLASVTSDGADAETTTHDLGLDPGLGFQVTSFEAAPGGRRPVVVVRATGREPGGARVSALSLVDLESGAAATETISGGAIDRVTSVQLGDDGLPELVVTPRGGGRAVWRLAPGGNAWSRADEPR